VDLAKDTNLDRFARKDVIRALKRLDASKALQQLDTYFTTAKDPDAAELRRIIQGGSLRPRLPLRPPTRRRRRMP
jgi:hypothetical protein